MDWAAEAIRIFVEAGFGQSLLLLIAAGIYVWHNEKRNTKHQENETTNISDLAKINFQQNERISNHRIEIEKLKENIFKLKEEHKDCKVQLDRFEKALQEFKRIAEEEDNV